MACCTDLPGIRGGAGSALESVEPAFEPFQAVRHVTGNGEWELLSLRGRHGRSQRAAGWSRDQYRSGAPVFTGMLSLSLGLELAGLGPGIRYGGCNLRFLIVDGPRWW